MDLVELQKTILEGDRKKIFLHIYSISKVIHRYHCLIPTLEVPEELVLQTIDVVRRYEFNGMQLHKQVKK